MALRQPARTLLPALTLTVTQLLWFVVPALLVRFGSLALPASYFSAGALAFMHCAQYLWITTYFAAREAGRTGRDYSFARHYFVLVVGGIALFIPGPWLASRILGHDFVESFLIFTALVNLHHFILDGAIWKLRDGHIARLLLGRNPPEPEKFQTPNGQTPNMTSHLGWLFGASPPARVTRWAFGVALLGLAALDQWQYYSTSHAAGPAALDRAAAVNPNDPRPAFRRAQLAEESGDWPLARHELAGILALNPRNSPAQHLLGEVLLRSGDTAAALAHYDRLFELYPDDLGVALNRGLAATGQQRAAQAVASYERATRLAPDNLAAHAGLAAALAEAKDPGRAIEEYEVVFNLCEQGAQTDYLAGYLDACLRQADLLAAASEPAAWERAAKRLQRAADIAATQQVFPVAVTALQRLAAVQDKLGRTDDAAQNRALAVQAAAFAK
jgi:tetratricopeptide (TPR) repeat protein